MVTCGFACPASFEVVAASRPRPTIRCDVYVLRRECGDSRSSSATSDLRFGDRFAEGAQDVAIALRLPAPGREDRVVVGRPDGRNLVLDEDATKPESRVLEAGDHV